MDVPASIDEDRNGTLRGLLRHVLCAAAAFALTAAMFVVLPLSMLYQAGDDRRIVVRDIDTAVLSPRPPPPSRVRRRTRPRPKPKMVRTAVRRPIRSLRSVPPRTSRVNLRLPISLALSLPSLPEDLGLDFHVAPRPSAPPGPDSADAGGGPFAEDAVDQPPRPVVQPPPVYPYTARLHHIEGWVDVEFTVTDRGEVTDPVVIEEHPPGVFGNAALAAVRRWRFEPGRKAGHPVPVRARVRLRFELRR